MIGENSTSSVQRAESPQVGGVTLSKKDMKKVKMMQMVVQSITSNSNTSAAAGAAQPSGSSTSSISSSSDNQRLLSRIQSTVELGKLITQAKESGLFEHNSALVEQLQAKYTRQLAKVLEQQDSSDDDK